MSVADDYYKACVTKTVHPPMPLASPVCHCVQEEGAEEIRERELGEDCMGNMAVDFDKVLFSENIRDVQTTMTGSSTGSARFLFLRLFACKTLL